MLMADMCTRVCPMLRGCWGWQNIPREQGLLHLRRQWLWVQKHGLLVVLGTGDHIGHILVTAGRCILDMTMTVI